MVWNKSGTIVPQGSRRGLLEVFGHSGARGNAVGRRMGVDLPSRLAAMLGATLADHSVGGAVLVRNEQTGQLGGQFHLFDYLNRYNNIVAPYTPDSDVVLIWYGLNDVALLGPTANDLLPFRQALRAAIAHARLAVRYEEQDPSVVYAGTWVQGFAASVGSAAGYKYATANGSTVTVNVPADFPGGEVDLFFLIGSAFMGTATATVDGVAAGATVYDVNEVPQDYATGANSQFGSHVLRFPGLAAGAHAIVVTMSGIGTTGSAIFDGWGIAAATPPLVVVPTNWRPYQYGMWATWPYNGINDADVATVNGIITAVAAEFDANVIVPDIYAAIPKATASFVADQTHLNDASHAKAARTVHDAIKAYMANELQADYDLRVRSAEDFIDPFGLGMVTTTDPRTTVGVGAYTLNTTYYSRAIGSGPVNTVGIIVGTASGNISVGHYPGDRWTSRKFMKPTGAKWRTAAIACPASGLALVNPTGGGKSYFVNDGDFLALSVDNATATFERSGTSTSALGACDGWSWKEAVHPCPATPGTLVSNAPSTTPFMFANVGR